MEKTYQFRVRGYLDESWATWLSGMNIEQQPDGSTTITGKVKDQAALFGLLSRIRDLGMPLISVNLLESTSLETQQPQGDSDR